METNNKQICTFIFKQAKYCLYLSSFYDRTVCANSMLPRQP
jgi:hypothetical protein